MHFYHRKQTGFTLVEISIVLVIIGLLLGGVLKGQEMISSAKVKALANEIRSVSTAYYAYQDKYRAIPGDDSAAVTHLGATVNGITVINAGNPANGVISTGTWVGTAGAPAANNQSSLFWNHTRAAGLLAGDGNIGSSPNAVGGLMGATGTSASNTQSGTAFVCSGSLDNKMAAQLDTAMDDGVGTTGSMQARVGAQVTAAGAPAAYAAPNIYTVCMGI